jgi:hypothetical protein
MAIAVQILGPEGTGKTASMKTLNAASTVYINCDKKPMPFRGWRKVYNKQNKNYIHTSEAPKIMSYLTLISDNRPEIKVVIVDTINSIMSDKEMGERKKKGFDKWLDYAGEIFDLYSLVNSDNLRDDLIVIFIGHVEIYEDNFKKRWRLKTGGNKLTKLNVEGKILYTLYTEIEFKDKKPSYYFVTQTDGTNTARSPEGCFDFQIPNNLGFVIKTIREFENSEETELLFTK